jgi:hypothetical protein
MASADNCVNVKIVQGDRAAGEFYSPLRGIAELCDSTNARIRERGGFYLRQNEKILRRKVEFQEHPLVILLGGLAGPEKPTPLCINSRLR